MTKLSCTNVTEVILVECGFQAIGKPGLQSIVTQIRNAIWRPDPGQISIEPTSKSDSDEPS
jgi:hypothetical protein